MAESYVVSSDRVLPLSYNEATIGAKTPHAVIQSITMGVRFGDQNYAIGYVHKFSFDMKRENKPIWQIEPYMDMKGENTRDSAPVGTMTFDNKTFEEGTTYYPGEAIEIIPGKMSPLELTLDRYSLYTGNLISAVLRSTGTGVYTGTATNPNTPVTGTEAIKYVSILQQSRPFDIYQIFVSPITGKAVWGRKFCGCWFTSIGEETPESDKNEPVIEKGKVTVAYLRPLTSSLVA